MVFRRPGTRSSESIAHSDYHPETLATRFDAGDTGATDPANIERAVTDDMIPVWMESPTNPFLQLYDLSAVTDAAAGVDATYVMDNTFATPSYTARRSI